MLFFIVAWTGLTVACFIIGSAVVTGVKADCFERDRFILSVWLGVVILAVALLAVSLVLPLSALVGVVVTFCLLAIALLVGHPGGSALSVKGALGFFGVASGVAVFTAREVPLYDTGLYHFQSIRWLSQFGAVPGLASFHYRLGFTSSWFALAAPFNAGIFEARVGAFLGGFALLLATVQFLISGVRIFLNQERFEDWFVITFFFLCLSILIWEEITISSSTDLPIIILTGVVSWAMLLAGQVKPNGATLNAKLIPLVLGAGAVSIKLSALPLLFVSGWFYVSGSRASRRLAVGSLISGVLLLPMLISSTITSGCPLFPSTKVCFALPWSVAETAQVVKAGRNWNVQPKVSLAETNFLTYLWRWLRLRGEITFLLIASLLSTFGLVKLSRRYWVPGQSAILGLGILGSLFTIYLAPYLRFGLGYFCLLPALVCAVCCQNKSPLKLLLLVVYAGIVTIVGWHKTGLAILIILPVFALVIWLYKRLAPKIFLVFLLLLMARVFLKTYLSSPAQLHLLLPPKMQTPNQLLTKQVNNVKYFTPAQSDRCWAAQLPCVPNYLDPKVRLRNSEQGLGAGFVREQ